MAGSRKAVLRQQVGNWPDVLGRYLRAAHRLGDRVDFTTADKSVVQGTVRFVGSLAEDPTGAIWIGIELDRAVGRHSGRGYFDCPKACGLFVRQSSLGPAGGAGQPAEDDSLSPAPFSIVLYDEATDAFVNWSGDGAAALHTLEPVAVSRRWAREYILALGRSGKFDCRIWPYHCLVGSPGASVVRNLLTAFEHWEGRHGKPVHYVTKGRNIRTEMYSAVKAEVVDPNDASTALNLPLIDQLQMRQGAIVFAGEAASHCVNYTVSDVLAALHDRRNGSEKRVVVLEDCCSAVAGCEADAADFFERVTKSGAHVLRSDSFSPPADSCICVIDPQNDFITGSLRVDGGEADMERTARWLEQHSDRCTDVFCSLDFHERNHIAHPMAWRIVSDGPAS